MLEQEFLGAGPGPGSSLSGQEPVVVKLTGLLQLHPRKLEQLYWEHTCTTTAMGLDQLFCVMSLITLLYALSTTKLPPASQQLHLWSMAALLLQSYLLKCRLRQYVRWRAHILVAVRLLKLLSLITMLISYLSRHQLRLASALDVARTGLVLTGIPVSTANALAYRLRFRHQVLVDAAMAAALVAAIAPRLSALLSAPANLSTVSRAFQLVSAHCATFFQHLMASSMAGAAGAGTAAQTPEAAAPACPALVLVAALQLFCCLVLPLYVCYSLERCSKLRFMYTYQQAMRRKEIRPRLLCEHLSMELGLTDKLICLVMYAVKLWGLLLVSWLVVDTSVHHVLGDALAAGILREACGVPEP